MKSRVPTIRSADLIVGGECCLGLLIIMPELPEVENVMRGLAQRLTGQRLVGIELRRSALRWPIPKEIVEQLTGKRITGFRRRAKYIIINFSNNISWIIHLGISGRMLVFNGSKPLIDIHDHVVCYTDSSLWIKFNDYRRFGMMDLSPTNEIYQHKLLKNIGPEPLDKGFSSRTLESVLSGKHVPIKAALLNQKLVAGIGNIYACEALHRSGILPSHFAMNITKKRAKKLVFEIKSVLTEAIAAGGTSIRDHRQVNNEPGFFQNALRVYNREGERCLSDGCYGTVKRVVQYGRSTFYCPQCQS
ncbi:formamidopyrimidine-DNA glycosylase [Candidatus Endolissoclinum faulkneri L2]|uniref:Formamidopyrimidine-DNA glycosylase n=1 Tax=Candidatus Endolissoclinum faulkneri L2 TaxID=1193729 RepID=K7ZCX2_9PROT|nr:formamidopyrimidine-DNA glycosylase [Candidatus Endolissoclinum faulkneri L2]